MSIPTPSFCCGVDGAFLDERFNHQEAQQTSRGIGYRYNKETIMIYFHHPNARIKGYFLYYALMDAVKEIEEIRKKHKITD